MTLTVLQILAVLVVALVATTTLAHALELPGKMRLDRDDYLKVQAIYYPGFTRLGIAEPLAVLILLGLAALTPFGTAAFWLTLGAGLALLATHAIYWIWTAPVNKVWVKDLDLGRADKRFFGTERGGAPEGDWTSLCDRWERSHVARAACALLGLVLITVATAI